MTRILLTGASGFLGSALARHWQRAAVELHLIVRPSSSLRRLESMPANVVIHSVADANAAAHVVTRVQPDVIIHTACTYGRVGESPLQILDANLALGIALLQSALSTQHAVSFINTGTVLAPHVSLYALSKRQFSEWGVRLALREPGQLRFVDLRLQHMYGPGDSRSKFSTDVLQACLRNEPALKLTAGQQRRDFVYIADVVAAYDILLARLDT